MRWQGLTSPIKETHTHTHTHTHLHTHAVYESYEVFNVYFYHAGHRCRKQHRNDVLAAVPSCITVFLVRYKFSNMILSLSNQRRPVVITHHVRRVFTVTSRRKMLTE